MARLLLRDLTPGTRYKVQLRAVEGDSVSEWSRLFDLPVSSDTTAPKVPVWASDAWVVNGDTFVATWLPLDFNEEDNKDFDRYEIELGTATSSTVIRTTNTSYTLTYDQNRILFGSANPTVTARVRSVDAVGNASAWTALKTATNPAPSPVDSITTTPLYDSVDIKWADATVEADFSGFVLQVSTTSASTGFTTVYTGPDFNYTYATVQFNTDHWFRVYVRDKFGSLSTAVTSGAVRPKSSFQVDTTPPATPTSLTAAITNNANGLGSRASLTWAQTIPATNDLAGFRVRWRQVGDTNWSATDFSHEDRAGVVELQAAFKNYEFQIRSYDWMGNFSAWTATVTANSPANTAPPVPGSIGTVAGRDSIRYSWSDVNTPDLKEYEVTVSTSSDFTTGNVLFRNGTSTTLNVGGLTPSTFYYMRIRAIDNLGMGSAYSSTVAKSTLPQLSATDVGAVNQTDMSNYVGAKGTDLVVNGFGTMNNNYNFISFTYDKTDMPVGSLGSFMTVPGIVGSSNIDELLPVDTTRKYKFSYQVKQKGTATTNAYFYGMVIAYDSLKLAITPQNYMFVAGTTTSLAAPLNPGDTTITLTSSANWYGSAAKPGGATTHRRSIIWWDFVDSRGRAWGPETFSRNWSGADYWADGGLVGNVITLKAPYSGPARPAGTKLSNGASGGTFIYAPGATNAQIPADWTTFAATIGGTANGVDGASFANGWPPGTAYARVGWLPNRTQGGGSLVESQMSVAAVSFTDSTAAQDMANAAQTTATTALTAANGKNKIVFSTSDATGTSGYIAGDIWYKRDANGVVVATWEFTTSWQPRTLGDGVLASLNVGKLVSGDVSAITINLKSTGAIKSDNYSAANKTGWKLDSSGLDVQTGSVRASALIGDTLGSSTGKIQIGAGASIVMNGGFLRSNTYSGDSYDAGASSGWYLDNSNLHIPDGNISAKALKTGVISGAQTIELSGSNAVIQSLGYTGNVGTGGFRLSGTGLSIPDGTLQAAKLLLQSSPNIMPAMYSDFEASIPSYTNKFTVDQGGVLGEVSTPGGRFGLQKLGYIWGAQASPIRVWLGTTTTDYNVPTEAGKTYIFSMYTYTNASGLNMNSTMYVKWSDGTITTLDSKTLTIADNNPANATRLVGVATAPAGTTGALIGWGSTTINKAGGIAIDGVQVEEKVSGSNNPSSYSRPSFTTIDGGQVKTGSIRSNAPALDVNGNPIPGVQSWQIDTEGNAVLGDALIRGRLVMGIEGDYEASTSVGTDFQDNTFVFEDTDKLSGIGSIQSYNYSPGMSGWAIRSNGFAEFLQLKANSIQSDAIEAVSPDKLNPGTVSADLIIGAALRSVEKDTLYVSQKSREGNVAILTTSESHTRVVGDRIQVRLDPPDSAFDTPAKNFATVIGTTDTTISYISPSGNTNIAATPATGTLYVEGRSVVMSPEGLTLFQNNGIDRIIDLPTDTLLPAYFAGDVEANSLTVKDDFLLQGLDNAVAVGGVFTLNSAVASPAGTPTLNFSWGYVQTWLNSEYSAQRVGLWYQPGLFPRYITTNTFYGAQALGIHPDGSFNQNVVFGDDAGGEGQNAYGTVRDNSGKWYLLANDIGDGQWKVRRYSTGGDGFKDMEASFNFARSGEYGATVKEWNSDGWYGSALRDPVLGYGTPDGINYYLYLARCTKAGKIIVTRYDTDGSNPVTITTNISDNQNLKSINVGSFDFGGYRMVITTEGNSAKSATNYVTSISGAHQPSETFPSPNNLKTCGMAWNGTNFVTLTQNHRLYTHTSLASTGSNVWYVKASFFDGNDSRTMDITSVSGNGTSTTITTNGAHGYLADDMVYVNNTLATAVNNAYYTIQSATSNTIVVSSSFSGSVGAGGTVTNEWETGLSGLAQATVIRRAKMTVSTSNIPVGAEKNQADRARFYFSNVSGGKGVYYRQPNPNPTVSQVFTGSPSFSGTTTTQTPFPAGTPAKIVSSALSPDGQPKMILSSDGTLKIDRVMLYSMGDVTGSPNDTPPLSIISGGLHLHMDGNEMQSYANGAVAGYAILPYGGNITLGKANWGVSVQGNLNIIGTLVGATVGNGTWRTTGEIHTNHDGNSGGGLYDDVYLGGGTTAANIGNGGRITRASSSRRFKKYIQPLELTEAKKALSLEPVTFVWKAEMDLGDRRQPGFIAEQAHEVGLSLWTTYDNDNPADIPSGFRYAELTAAHNMLIKELYAKVESLEAELTTLRG